MTRKEAALNTYILWAWLERNPGKNKKDHPLYYELGLDIFIDECPWCELFRFDYENGECNNCPLLSNDMECIDIDSDAYNYDSPFYKWYFYKNKLDGFKISKKAAIAAGEIARIAWKEYKRLGG